MLFAGMVIPSTGGFPAEFKIPGISNAMKESNMSTVEQDGLIFHVQFDLFGDNLLECTYQVRNTGDRDCYLLNRIYKTYPRWNINPDIIYVYFQEYGIVHLMKAIPPVPPDVSPTSLMAPYVTPVRAGQVFSETVHLELPLQEYQEYALREPQEKAQKVELYKGIYLTLGYMFKVEGTVEKTEIYQGDTLMSFVNPPGILSPSGLLVSPVVALEIPVLIRYNP
ncbi:MAG: hypothetical protein C4524_14980 [Candidatus Zixiibacteriota bacterium]|nr:MAG: hypothetical protein C4524_14980 [candidate division Zixibacteria bacterium]